MELLQIATALFIFKSVWWSIITNCEFFFITKLRHGLLKIEKVFQSGMTITNCDSKT